MNVQDTIRTLPPGVSRRLVLCSLLAGMSLLAANAAFAASAWHNVDISGYSPSLAFTMKDANTGKTVTAADFRGKIVMLYLGYTQCPDVCPLTLQRVASVLDRLGKDADDIRFLFVTVDPTRDTVPVLKAYTSAFSPDYVGLRGDADQIADVARRYRLAYSVQPATKTHPYEVTHSSAICVFDRDGKARLLLASLATTTPDIAGTAEDLDRLMHAPKSGLLSRIGAIF